MKKVILNLTDAQISFIITAIERECHSIWEDPEAYDFNIEDYKNEKEMEKDVQKFVDQMYHINEQLEK